MTELYLIRHGQTEWNAERRIQGHGDAPLTAKGVEGAEAVARRLAPVPFRAIYTSDLPRAYRTAEILNASHKLPLQSREELREVFFGEWEGRTTDELERDETEADLVAKWREDSFLNRPPGGERLEELQARVVRALEEIVTSYPDGPVAVVSHGGSIKAAASWALELPLTHWRRFEINNVSITRIDAGGPRGLVLLYLNDYSHYPDEE